MKVKQFYGFLISGDDIENFYSNVEIETDCKYKILQVYNLGVTRYFIILTKSLTIIDFGNSYDPQLTESVTQPNQEDLFILEMLFPERNLDLYTVIEMSEENF